MKTISFQIATDTSPPFVSLFSKPLQPNNMQKTILLIIATNFIIYNVNSQITKGNWLVGGSTNFSTIQYSSAASLHYKQTNFQINPIVGYFLKDKFALGLRPSLSYGRATGSNNTVYSSGTVINIGPFARYYFLKPENIFNLFAQGSYGYGTVTGGQRSNTFSFAAGPVLYFNSSVGLEFTIGYSTTKSVGFSGNNNEVLFGIGFQIHLEKDK